MDSTQLIHIQVRQRVCSRDRGRECETERVRRYVVFFLWHVHVLVTNVYVWRETWLNWTVTVTVIVNPFGVVSCCVVLIDSSCGDIQLSATQRDIFEIVKYALKCIARHCITLHHSKHRSVGNLLVDMVTLKPVLLDFGLTKKVDPLARFYFSKLLVSAAEQGMKQKKTVNQQIWLDFFWNFSPRSLRALFFIPILNINTLVPPKGADKLFLVRSV